jgi:hypothetical protein
MSLIKCAECQAEISTTAKSCPKCGAVVPKPPIWPWVVGVPVAVLALIMVWSGFKPEYEHNANAARRVCEKNLGGSRDQCDRVHSQIMSDGRKAAETPAQRAAQEKENAAAKAYHQAAFDKERAADDKEQEAIKKRVTAECAPLLGEKKTRYRALFVSGRYWDAATVLRACAKATDDPALKKMVADAELKSYVTDINDPYTSTEQKLQAITSMSRDFPDQAKKYAALEKKLSGK